MTLNISRIMQLAIERGIRENAKKKEKKGTFSTKENELLYQLLSSSAYTS